jgi:hypothetical protein
MLFLTTMPLWLSGLILIVPTTALAMAGPYVVRHYIKLSRLRTNNEIAGFKFATVGVLYAVLLAFAVIVVWEKFNEADNIVAKEAGAAATIYRLSNGINVEQGTAISKALSDYLDAAITKDWPAMQRGKASRAATETLNNVYSAVLKYRPADNSGAILLAELLRQVDAIGEARRARLVTANGIVPGIVWLVLFGGAAITIGFTFFFGAENLRAQSAMTGALSVLVFAGLLTIVAIDHPFAGQVRVGPEPLVAVVDDFGTASQR